MESVLQSVCLLIRSINQRQFFLSQFSFDRQAKEFICLSKLKVLKLFKMFRQAANKLKPSLSLSSMYRRVNIRNCCNEKKKPEPLCAHHKELVPPFCVIGKLNSFELKSDCNTFHMKSVGQCPCPCPDDNPCDSSK